MDTVFGLPTHPLAVHAPVVLVPIAALVTVVLAVHQRWRRRTGWWLPAAVAGMLVLLVVARQSGRALDEALAGAVDMSVHERLADQTVLLTLLWLVLVIVVVALDRAGAAAARPVSGVAANTANTAAASVGVATRVAAGLAAAIAIAVVVWLVRTGHEGAYPTWRPTVELYLES